MIRELVDEGTTVLLTTQYLEEADQLAERIAVIDGGHVIANDTPARLKADLGDTVVEMDFADEPTRRAGGGHCSAATSSARSSASTARCGSPPTAGLACWSTCSRRFDGDGVEPDTLSVREPSLDDVFLALTGHRAEAGETTTGDAA